MHRAHNGTPKSQYYYQGYAEILPRDPVHRNKLSPKEPQETFHNPER